MLSALLKLLLHNQNQFASGGLLLMAIGGIAAYLRGIPLLLWNAVKNQVTMTLTITDSSSAFTWFKWWFQSHPKCGKIRQVDAYTPYSNGVYCTFLGPAPGCHWIWYKNRPVRIEFKRTEEKQVFGTTRTESFRTESFTLATLGRDQKFFKEMLQELRETYDTLTACKPRLHIHSDKEWIEIGGYVPRTLDSVILPQQMKAGLVQDVDTFLSSRTWYEQQGVPYRRGYLLYGLPGTGKTSLIQGLANHFGLNVYVVNLNEVSDSGLASAVRQAEPRSIILLEDVDCMNNRKKIAKDAKESLGASLSGVLNVLDGAQSPQNVMFFMTTNHVDNLDDAILRAGRCDVKIEFGEASADQKSEFYTRLFPTDSKAQRDGFILARPAKTIAEFQEAALSERNERLNNAKSATSFAD